MDKPERMTFDIPPAAAAAVREAVQNGAYRSESDAVADALHEWQAVQATRAEQLDRLRSLIDEGDRGPFFSEEEAFARVEATIAKYDPPA